MLLGLMKWSRKNLVEGTMVLESPDDGITLSSLHLPGCFFFVILFFFFLLYVLNHSIQDATEASYHQ